MPQTKWLLNVFCFSFAILLPATLRAASGEDFYLQKIQPIFNSRCIACHSCYNAPCQLNLQSYDGFVRGAHKLGVYNGLRLNSVEPSRMFEDAISEKQWRAKGFVTVNTSKNSDESFFFQMLKNLNDNRGTLLRPVADSLSCVENATEAKILKKLFPQIGMPFALPSLNEQELADIKKWVETGSRGPTSDSLEKSSEILPETKSVLNQWEEFLNKDDLSHKLVARYIFEHMFLAHAYTPNDKTTFFKLVRSKSKCKNEIEIIATRRPNDSPGTDKFYYCFEKYKATIVSKTHLPYEVSETKLKRIEKIFFTTPFEVSKLPSYESGTAENPFVAFQDIPVKARYEYLLEDAHYQVATFIKGPVCNGSNAVNSIQEQFYVFFLDPKSEKMALSPEFAKSAAKMMALPGFWGSDVEVSQTPALYKQIIEPREAYRLQKAEWLAKNRPKGLALDDIWDGNGENDNAVLTVFRHFDNAVVLKGAKGDLSKTVFVLDYALLERLVYNLVVNFDVFGNVGHQLLTRIYMDLIRMEAEELFLQFLPPGVRSAYRYSWYKGLLTQAQMNYIFPEVGAAMPTSIHFEKDEKHKEQFVTQILFKRMNEKVRGSIDGLNWKQLKPPNEVRNVTKVDKVTLMLRKLASVRATDDKPFAQYFPDVAYLRVVGEKGNRVFTLIHNKEHQNISWILGESFRLAPEQDTLTILEGFAGSYPNLFFTVDEAQISSFIDMAYSVKSTRQYDELVTKFGLKRSDARFWSVYDDLYSIQKSLADENLGYLDLTLYEMIF